MAFRDTITGYHLINGDIIRHAVWEGINKQVYTNLGIEVMETANNGHAPGMDIVCAESRLSNKTSLLVVGKKVTTDISSYRLSKEINDKDENTQEQICEIINSKKNFKFYSLLTHRRVEGGQVEYRWYMIPSSHQTVSPETYTWEKTYGKTARTEGIFTGWKTNTVDGSSMFITFSMSSQLWMKVDLTNMDEYIRESIVVSPKPVMDYAALAALVAKQQQPAQ